MKEETHQTLFEAARAATWVSVPALIEIHRADHPTLPGVKLRVVKPAFGRTRLECSSGATGFTAPLSSRQRRSLIKTVRSASHSRAERLGRQVNA